MNKLFKSTLFGAAVIGMTIGIANANWLNPEQGMEVDANSITLPPYANGTISVTKCADCESLDLVATNSTLYYVAPGAPPVSLADLRTVFYASTHDEEMIIYVFFDPNTMAVNRLVLDRSN